MGANQFQLTHLLRGATGLRIAATDAIQFQLTHLLRGATISRTYHAVVAEISTHAPLARCDSVFTALLQHPVNFNSRTSCEVRPGRDDPHRERAQGFQLTHLLRGATRTPANDGRARGDFNSRTSCEVRPGADLRRQGRPISTHAPLARCDATRRSTGRMYFISTHAPLARCDPAGQDAGKSGVHISTHAPLARCDWPLNG